MKPKEFNLFWTALISSPYIKGEVTSKFLLYSALVFPLDDPPLELSIEVLAIWFAIAEAKSFSLVFNLLASFALLMNAVSIRIAGILDNLKTAKFASLCPLLVRPNLLANADAIFFDNDFVEVLAVG